VNGYWARAASGNGELSSSITVEAKVTNSKTTKEEISNGLKSTVGGSFGVEGIGSASFELSYEFTKTVSSEFSSAIENTNSYTIEANCKQENPNERVVLW